MSYRKTRPAWYIKNVPSKKNETWPLEDRILVYTLRVQNKSPIDRIVKVLNKKGKKASKVKVYNLIRQSRKVFLGKCYRCGKDLSEKEKKRKSKKFLRLCNSCQEIIYQSKRKTRLKYIKQGLCSLCGTAPFIKGF